MKIIRWISLALLLFILVACTSVGNGNGSGTDLPTPQISTTFTPDEDAAMRAYLDAMLVEEYETMYTILTQVSRDAISLDEFTNRYRNARTTMNVQTIDYSILSTLKNPRTAQVAFRIIYRTSVLGDIQRDMVANFSLEGGAWKLQWDDGLILPELAGGKKLYIDLRTPSRGDIYDRNGLPIVTQAEAVALGFTPAEVPDGQQGLLLSELSKLTGLTIGAIQALYENVSPEYYIPVGEATAEAVEERYAVLSSIGGLRMNSYSSRYYFDGGVAAQAIGYTLPIFPEEVEEYQRKGYSLGQRVGKAGVEQWGESYLAGTNGASLYVTSAEGAVETRIASTDPQPAASITLTIDKNLQIEAQQAMSGMTGAIVVLEVNTGRVLAMISSPTFDSNFFDPNNFNSLALEGLVNDPTRPLINRAVQENYPLGSVFKLITAAAALESGLFTAESEYDCQYEFTELVPYGGPVLYDWTWERCEREKRESGEETCDTKPSGLLTLPEGLMRSCNPWFYHLGLDLFNQSRTTNIHDMALGFGLGQPTGIEIAESPGNIPLPESGTQATSLAIGQGDTQVTPLQVAVFTAAIANGGTLYRPSLIESVQPVIGDAILTFEPQVNGTLPISADTLQILQDAMLAVTTSPRGTAYRPMRGLNYLVAGKTGTAETGVPGSPHSWFAGFTQEEREDKPDIAIAVIVEFKGEGSEFAAPIFRRVVEAYFTGRARTVYPWESSIGVTKTPTPEGGETPTPIE